MPNSPKLPNTSQVLVDDRWIWETQAERETRFRSPENYGRNKSAVEHVKKAFLYIQLKQKNLEFLFDPSTFKNLQKTGHQGSLEGIVLFDPTVYCDSDPQQVHQFKLSSFELFSLANRGKIVEENKNRWTMVVNKEPRDVSSQRYDYESLVRQIAAEQELQVSKGWVYLVDKEKEEKAVDVTDQLEKLKIDHFPVDSPPKSSQKSHTATLSSIFMYTIEMPNDPKLPNNSEVMVNGEWIWETLAELQTRFRSPENYARNKNAVEHVKKVFLYTQLKQKNLEFLFDPSSFKSLQKSGLLGSLEGIVLFDPTVYCDSDPQQVHQFKLTAFELFQLANRGKEVQENKNRWTMVISETSKKDVSSQRYDYESLVRQIVAEQELQVSKGWVYLVDKEKEEKAADVIDQLEKVKLD